MTSRDGPCRHRGTAPYMDVTKGQGGQALRRHACDLCHCSWWESNGHVTKLPDVLEMISGSTAKGARLSPGRGPATVGPGPRRRSRPGPVGTGGTPPAAAGLLALVGLVGHAIGTDRVLFAAVSDRGWQVIDLGGVLGAGTVRTGPGTESDPLALSGAAREWERAFTSVATLGQPAELVSSALATACPRLAADGVRRLVAVPVYGPAGVAAVIVAAYPAGAEWAQDDFLGPSTETVGYMGRLLQRAYGPPTSRPPTVPVRGLKPMSTAREVATIFGVTSRTVSNWVASGTLAASRTAGGHLRFTAGDVEVLHGRLLTRPKEDI